MTAPMSWFTAETNTEAVVAADREAIWKVLVDPDLVAEITPMLQRIDVDGDLWTWQLTRLPVLNVAITPCFTERMTFDEMTRIDYDHAPPEGATENTGVNGWYTLADVEGGTHLAMGLTVSTKLPLPRAAGPAVRTAMKAVIARMGAGFSRNLHRHLGIPQP
jgi:carbon monoxide dehydrogenase subunit G